MSSLRDHPQSVRVKQAVLSTAKSEEIGHIKIGNPVARQTGVKIVVENFKTLCVSDLLQKLPVGSQIFCRANNRGPDNQILSCCDVYYPLDDRLWRCRNIILAAVWILPPVIAFFCVILAS